LSNGELLRRASTAGFTVLVTADQSIPHQQNLAGFGLAVVVLKVRRNRIQELRPLVSQLLQALEIVQPGQVMRLGAHGS